MSVTAVGIFLAPVEKKFLLRDFSFIQKYGAKMILATKHAWRRRQASDMLENRNENAGG